MTILMRNYVKFMHRFSQDAFCKNSLKAPWTTILRFVGKIYVIFVLPSTKILQNWLDHVILFNLFEVTDREKEESQRPRQTEGSSPGLSQRDYSSPHWTGLKPGAGSSFWIPDMGNRNPNSGHSPCFSKNISRNLSFQVSNWHPFESRHYRQPHYLPCYAIRWQLFMLLCYQKACRHLVTTVNPTLRGSLNHRSVTSLLSLCITTKSLAMRLCDLNCASL